MAEISLSSHAVRKYPLIAYADNEGPDLPVEPYHKKCHLIAYTYTGGPDQPVHSFHKKVSLIAYGPDQPT